MAERLDMSSTRPYLLRAFYEWIVDNGCTPHIVIDAQDEAALPRQHIVDGKLVLNVSPSAVRDLVIGDDRVTLSTRFNGVATPIDVPISQVLAVYARENGRGIEFGLEERAPPATPEPPVRGRPKLKLVD